MQGTAPTFILAEIGIPGAWQCLEVAAPFLAFFSFRWLIRQVDPVIDRLFPHWEWEKRLGWLNIRLVRRADRVLRWLGYLVYAVLVAALYGIVWAAPVLEHRDNWNDPAVASEFATKMPVLLISLGLWLIYFGFVLIPGLRKQYEAEELEKYRAGLQEAERDRQSRLKPGSRFASTPALPRLGSDRSARSGRLGPGN